MAAKKKKGKEAVIVDESTHKKVKNHVKTTKQSIGGFFTLAAEEKLLAINETKK